MSSLTAFRSYIPLLRDIKHKFIYKVLEKGIKALYRANPTDGCKEKTTGKCEIIKLYALKPLQDPAHSSDLKYFCFD